MQIPQQANVLTAILGTTFLFGSLTGCSGTFTVSPNASALRHFLSGQAQNGNVHNRGEIDFQPDATSSLVSDRLSANSTDRYTLQASAEQPASISIDSLSREVILAIIAPDGTPVVRPQSELMTWTGTLPTDGTYTVEAINVGDDAEYNLRVTIDRFADSGSQTFNRGEIDFQPGTTSTVLEGNLPATDDSDRYFFNASAGQSAQISISSPNKDVMLTLITPNGEPLTSALNASSYWIGRLPESGAYMLKATALGEPSDYSLSLELESQ